MPATDLSEAQIKQAYERGVLAEASAMTRYDALRRELARYVPMGYTAASADQRAYELEHPVCFSGPYRVEPSAAAKRRARGLRLAAAYLRGSEVAMYYAVREHGTAAMQKRLRAVGVDVREPYVPDESKDS